MTIREAIDLTDSARPNAHPDERKLRWLSRLDRRAWEDVLATHTPAPAPFDGYGTSTPQDTPLLIPEPYDRLYTLYLAAEMEFLDGEYTRYNNTVSYFNRLFADWANRYHETHLPMTGPCVQVLGRR